MATKRLMALLSACLAAGWVGCGGGGGGGTTVAPRRTAEGCVAGTESLSIVSGDRQSGAPGALLPERPTVSISCESFDQRGSSMPLAGATLEWSVSSGRSLIDGTTSLRLIAASDGTSSVSWTLPHAFGTSHQVDVRWVGASNLLLRVSLSATVASTSTSAQRCDDAGGTNHTAVIATDTAWSAAGSPHHGRSVTLTSGAVLHIEPGALVCVDDIDAPVAAPGRVVATGSTSAPIRFRGTALRAPIALSHADGENVRAVGSEAHPARSIDDSSFRWTVQRDPAACAQVIVEAGASVRRTLIEGYGAPGCAALRRISGPPSCDFYYCYGTIIEARIVASLGDGVSIDGEADVSLTNCQVSTSAGHGILVDTASTGKVTASGCNLFGNGGDAIANRSTRAIDAPDNWWGDSGGPSGPGGDRTSGLVDVASPQAAPLALGY